MFLDSTLPENGALRFREDRTDGEDMRRFVQRRLSLYTGMLGGLLTVQFVFGLLLMAVIMPERLVAVHVHPAKVLHLTLSAALVGWALVLRRLRLGERALRAVDAGNVLFVSLGVSAAFWLAPAGFHLELGALLLLLLALVLRAAVIPSTPRFTAFVGLVSSPPVVAAGVHHVALTGDAGLITPVIMAFGLGAWCIAATAATAVVSHVVYGLVLRVREVKRLGQYTLGDKIGEGGMGAVYRAQHAMLRRPTAVKLLSPERLGPDGALRFEREVQLTSQLSHPNTIAIYDYGRTPQGTFYYAMEYLEGRSLDELVEVEGPQPPGRVAHILAQMAGALAEAHAVGLIHRDIKPGNVLLCTRGCIPEFVKVIDFGLVKRMDGGGNVSVTQAGTLAGTPLFMAPECITRPDAVTGAIDTYALGATAYFLIAGAPPFSGATVMEVCGHHLCSEVVPPSRRVGRSLPPKLEALVLRCLAKDPSERPDDRELRERVADCQRESPWQVEMELSIAPSSAAE
jgi:hypothetical protein